MIGPAGAAFLASALVGAAVPADEGIVVTAQRREQRAEDVGVALGVVDAGEIARRGVYTVNDLQRITPNLEVEPAFGSGQPQFRIRGVGFQDYATNNAPTVGLYVNEVAQAVPVMTQGLIFDVARIEVLRGPQGTLYGRNTTGGAINIVTNQPTARPVAGLSAEYGRFDQFRGEAFVSGPIADGLDVRVAAATEQGGGFQHDRTTGRPLGDADRSGVRGLLRWRTGGLTATVDLHLARDHSENIGLRLLDPLQTSLRPGVTGPVIPADTDRRLTGWGISPTLARDADLPGDKPGRRNLAWGTSLNLAADLGPVKLTSITGYDRLRRREYGDYDASASIEGDVFFGSRVRVLSQELRLSSDTTGPLTWVGGVYLSEQRLAEQYFSDFVDIYGTYARVNYRQRVRSASGFGQLDYRLTRQLSLVAGLRYERETRVLTGFGSAFGGAQALPPTNERTRMRPLTGKIGLELRPRTGLLFYASASKGVKSGGFTTYNTGSASGIAPFAPERLYAYEAGIKATLARVVQLDGAVFTYDYRDQQVLDAVCGANGPVGRFANAPKSRITGVEGSIRLTPAHGLTATAYASYKRGEYKEYEALDLAACRAIPRVTAYLDKSGARIPFPKVELGGTIGYDLPVGRFVLTPTASASYRSRYYSWLGARYDIPRYWLVDAELALTPAHGAWSAALWGRNILDKNYDLTRNFFTSANIAQPGRPASYGVRFGYQFGAGD